MKKTQSAIRIPMPLRYLINLVLILALWFVLYTLIQNGTITNYWSGFPASAPACSSRYAFNCCGSSLSCSSRTGSSA